MSAKVIHMSPANKDEVILGEVRFTAIRHLSREDMADWYWRELERAANREGLTTAGIREIVDAHYAARKDGGGSK